MRFIGNITSLAVSCRRLAFEGNAEDSAGGAPVLQGTPVLEGPAEVTWRWVAGTNAYVAAAVTGAEPMSYTWYDGANRLYGVSGSSFWVSNNWSLGPFYAVVSNAFGMVTSRVTHFDLSLPMDVARRWETNGTEMAGMVRSEDGKVFSMTTPPVTLTGAPRGPTTFRRHDTNVVTEWSRELFGPTASGRSLAVDGEGNLVVWGDWTTSIAWGTNREYSNQERLFLAKLNAEGEVLWVTAAGQGRTNRAGNVVVRSNEVWAVSTATVNFTNVLPGGARFVEPTHNVAFRRFDLEGQLQETISITNMPPLEPSTNRVIGAFTPARFGLLPDGGFVVGGQALHKSTNQTGSLGVNIASVVAFDRDGEFRWAQQYRYSGNIGFVAGSGVSALAVDEEGNSYVAGAIHQRYNEGFISKVSPDGTELWRTGPSVLNASTGEGVLFQSMELLENGNLRVGGVSSVSQYTLQDDQFARSTFVMDFSPAGRLVQTIFFPLFSGDLRAVEVDALFSLNGEIYVAADWSASFNAGLNQACLAVLGFLPPSSTSGPLHRIVSADGGAILRPTFRAAGPVAFEWRRNGQIVPEESFSYLSLSPAEVLQPASYTLVVRNLAGSLTNAPIQLGWMRLRAKPLELEVASPVGAEFEIRFRESLGATDGWVSLTNAVSTGTPVQARPEDGSAQGFYHVIAK